MLLAGYRLVHDQDGQRLFCFLPHPLGVWPAAGQCRRIEKFVKCALLWQRIVAMNWLDDGRGYVHLWVWCVNNGD